MGREIHITAAFGEASRTTVRLVEQLSATMRRRAP
jgi:hypothetical protein